MDQNNTTSARGAKGRTTEGRRRRSPKAGGSVQMQAQDHIGRQLRAVYDDVLSQPVPDRFLALLDQLDQQKARDANPPSTRDDGGKTSEGAS